MSRELTLEKWWRLRQKKKEWFIEQEFRKKHEKRKLKMIQEYERKRAQMLLKLNMEDLTNTKKNSQREIIFTDNKHSEKLKEPRSENKEKRMQRIMISISEKKSPNDKDTSKSQTNKDINFENITIPRREEEGSRPIFERDEIRKKKLIKFEKFNEQRIVWLQDDNKSEHQLQTNISTSRENADVCDRNSDNEILHDYRSHLNYSKSITYQDDEINDKNKYESNRRCNSVKENNKEVRKQIIEKELNKFSNDTESNKYQDRSSDDIKDQKDKTIKKNEKQDKNSHRRNNYDKNHEFYHHIPPHPFQFNMNCNGCYHYRRCMYKEFNYWPPQPKPYYALHNTHRVEYNTHYALPFLPHRWPHPPRFIHNWNKDRNAKQIRKTNEANNKKE